MFIIGLLIRVTVQAKSEYHFSGSVLLQQYHFLHDASCEEDSCTVNEISAQDSFVRRPTGQN